MRRCAEGIELRVKVVPGASRSELAGTLGDHLKFRIAAPPEDGKANQALLLLICAWLGTKNVELIAGRANPEKTVRVNGVHQLSDEHMRHIK